MITLTLVAKRPFINPDSMIVKAAVSGNYTQGTPDALPLNAILDPQAIGQVPLNNPPAVTPAPFNENIGGYMAVVSKGASLSGYGVRFYLGGTELATGAYPAAIAGGELTFEILVPLDQQD